MAEMTPTARHQEDIIKRYSERPGFKLLYFREVGLPIYYSRLRAVVMERKPIPPISEFVLKSMDLGFREEEELAGILGVESDVLRRALVDLRRAEEVDLVAPDGSRIPEWAVTKKGKATLLELARIVPEEVSLPVYYDGLLRRVVSREHVTLMTPRELRDASLLQIAPMPARRPEVDEINIAEVNEAIRNAVRKRRGRRDLLVVKSILRADLLFHRALMLVFQSVRGDDLQVGFVVDGLPSPEHEQVFVRGGGLRRLGIVANADIRSANEIARDLLPASLISSIGDLGIVEAMQQEARLAEIEAEQVDESLPDATDEAELSFARERVDTARSRAQTLREKLSGLPVLLVETYEHRGFLEKALRESKERLLINSPWINSSAVTHEFLRSLEERLRGGLNVFIAYGLDNEQRPQARADREAIQALRALQRTYQKRFRFTWLGDTHAKVLISDCSFMVVTSFNWLSFRGDPRRTFRDERGVLVKIPAVIEAQFAQILKRMDDAEAMQE